MEATANEKIIYQYVYSDCERRKKIINQTKKLILKIPIVLRKKYINIYETKVNVFQYYDLKKLYNKIIGRSFEQNIDKNKKVQKMTQINKT